MSFPLHPQRTTEARVEVVIEVAGFDIVAFYDIKVVGSGFPFDFL